MMRETTYIPGTSGRQQTTPARVYRIRHHQRYPRLGAFDRFDPPGIK